MAKLSYYTQLVIFSALVFIGGYLASQKFGIPQYYIALLSVYFTGFSFILNKQLQSALHDSNKNKFTNTFLALTALKMFSCLLILLFGLFFAKANKLEMGICTMTYYMLYTTLEVVYWLGKLKQN